MFLDVPWGSAQAHDIGVGMSKISYRGYHVEDSKMARMSWTLSLDPAEGYNLPDLAPTPPT